MEEVKCRNGGLWTVHVEIKNCRGKYSIMGENKVCQLKIAAFSAASSRFFLESSTLCWAILTVPISFCTYSHVQVSGAR